MIGKIVKPQKELRKIRRRLNKWIDDMPNMRLLERNSLVERAEGYVREFQSRHPMYIHRANILMDNFRSRYNTAYQRISVYEKNKKVTP